MKHLSKEQRYAISVMYKENKTQTEMAKAIGVSRSTICRELKRNMRPHGKVYNYQEAHLVSQKRWRNSKKHVKLTEDMRTLILNMLTLFWSPQQIAGYCKSQGIDCVSHERIYQMIWQDKKDGGTLYQQLRRRGRKYRKRGSKYLYGGTIPNRVDISERPPVVDGKERFGDLEGDLVIGKDQLSAIITIVDRMTNFSWTAMVAGKKVRRCDQGHHSDAAAVQSVPAHADFRQRTRVLRTRTDRQRAGHQSVFRKAVPLLGTRMQ